MADNTLKKIRHIERGIVPCETPAKAHKNPNNKLSSALIPIISEYERAITKYPRFNSAHEGIAVLLEKVEELKQEVFEKNQNHMEMKAEAVQIGAIAIRFILECCEEGL